MLNATPKSIEKVEDEAMRIVWEDGHKSEYDFATLRRSCPCAMCKDEWTGEPLLDPATVPDALTGTRADIVGNYALTFTFGDGHGTGIYTFELLRNLCGCPECSYHPGSETN